MSALFNAQTLRGFRLLSAAGIAAAVITQWIDGVNNSDTFTVANFFSFFTIQSNLIAAVVLVLLATTWRENRTETQTLIRGAAVAYMTTTGVVYGLLLSGYSEELQTTLPWVDTMLHRVIPLVMVIDWMIDRPHNPLRFKQCLVWAIYPVAYLVYSLIRGPIVDWYPYPFLNPDEAGGYAGVAAYSVGIAVGFLAFIWLIVTLGNRPWEERRVVAPA
jgi:hypothetical protein